MPPRYNSDSGMVAGSAWLRQPKGSAGMDIAVIGAGNSGLAMAAHLSSEGHRVRLWNRSRSNIEELIRTHVVRCQGVIQGDVAIHLVTDDMERAVSGSRIILITTPATSHKELSERLVDIVDSDALIVLNPGRTFGALEFSEVFGELRGMHNSPTIAETQTTIYTCRRTGPDSVDIISLKSGVLISTLDPQENDTVVAALPSCLQQRLIPAKSMIETSIGNVGMILHCAPLLLNTGWTESETSVYKYYYDGITPSVGRFIEKIDEERVMVSEALGTRVESTVEWLKRIYHVQGQSILECIRNNEAYRAIDAPRSLRHRYVLEDVPCGLVPLEFIGREMGFAMKYTGLTIDLASSLLDTDFRKIGRRQDYLRRILPSRTALLG